MDTEKSNISENGWYVYILRCADGTYYTGITNNVERRVSEHNRKVGAKYTRSRTPVTLVYSETADSKSAALSREAAIKKLSRQEKIDIFQL